jgi:hypothetical protein
MKKLLQIASAGALLLGTMGVSRAMAQDPMVTGPIIASEVAPIIISAVKPKPKPTGLAKFEGTVLHANSVQITVKARGNDLAIQTFPLSEAASLKMQVIPPGCEVQRETVEAPLIPEGKCCACLPSPDSFIPPIPVN